MKWENNRQSDQVEDRRNSPGGGLPGGGRRLGGRGVGLGTIVVALVAGWALGINPMTVLSVLGGGELALDVDIPPGADEGSRTRATFGAVDARVFDHPLFAGHLPAMREQVLACPFVAGLVHEDLDFYWRFFSRHPQVYALTETVIHYRRRAGHNAKRQP